MMPRLDEKLTYSLREAAELIGIGWDILDRGCRRKHNPVPHCRIGRERRMTPEQIRQYIASCEVTPESEGQPAAEPEPNELEARRAGIRQRVARRQGKAA